MPFMIKNEAGLFSTGGKNPDFVLLTGKKAPKIWNTMGQVKSHLAQWVSFKGENCVPRDWTVVEVKIHLDGSIWAARGVAAGGATKKAEQHKDYQNKRELEEAKRELQELNRLQVKYNKA
jgi:hypothetical protein